MWQKPRSYVTNCWDWLIFRILIVLGEQIFLFRCYDKRSGRTGLTKFFWPFHKSRQNLSLPNFQFVKCGRTEKQQNNVNYKCQSHEKKIWLNLAAFNLISRDVTCTCTRLTRMVCIWMCIWSVCKGMYKLNSTWPWRCKWTVNLWTVIVVFLVLKDDTEERIFHLHRLIATQIWNNFGGLRIGLKCSDFKNRSNFFDWHFPSNRGI